MNWMFEPRSKYWYDDEDEGGSYSPPMQWHEILLFPVYAVLMMVFFAILEIVIIPAGLIYHEFSETVQRISVSGEFEFPRLAALGIVVGIVLPLLIWSGSFSVSAHPFITLCSGIYIILFTLAPLMGLFLHWLKHR